MAAVRFCSACGASLPYAPPVTCPACGVQHWRNPKPCANAIVVGADRLLLTRRAAPPWKDMWCSPGGFCEPGEHPTETVHREVYEETGLLVEVGAYLGVWVDHYADAPSCADEIINVAYYLAVPSGYGDERPEPAEISEVAWFPWSELPAPLAPPGTLAAVLTVADSVLRGSLVAPR